MFLRLHVYLIRNPAMKTSVCLLAAFLLLCQFDVSFASGNRPLMRFPDVHDNTIVFIYGEDIWSVPAEGGVATRLTIHDGDERFPKFSPDGRMIATSRLEGSGRIFGDPNACTLVATASPPYGSWSYARSGVTRLDGPCLFRHDGQVFAVGRYQPQRAPPFWHHGSIFTKKRTSLFLVSEASLVYFSDLPSAGDTSYAGAVLLEDAVYISYYTSPIDRDHPWITGMLSQTDIRVAKISLAGLAAVAVSRGR